uniref:Neurogenic locus notch homolog protein 2-like n=1 Tax=Sinocyclocheilus rhinocerous TaxID=307959 RepID=A0A673G7A3_9TELE
AELGIGSPSWAELGIGSPSWDCSLIDACATNPCANGARCTNWNNHYNCSCPPGYQGKNCRNDIDECRKPGKCLNGGICMNTHGSFRCECLAGYSGHTCEVPTQPCAPSQCLNGGTCHQTGDHTYECCPVGKTGLLCHLDDACVSNPCNEGAVCDTNPLNGRAICTCPAGFVGGACNQDMDECSIGANPCEHFGKCVNTEGSFQCQCGRGYTGPRCEIDINECLSMPCQNDATCLDRIGEFTCICMPGFTGTMCQIDIDECASTPCQNGAKCIDRPNGYECRCAEGKLLNEDVCLIVCACCARALWSPSGFKEPVEQQRLYANLIPLHSYRLAQPLRCRANRKVPFSAHSPLHISSLSSGFEGRLCESNIDNCKPDPCHHGTCIDGIASYTCNCEPGYTGYRCENQLNECHSNPCQNGGKCVDLVNMYICQCQHGTSGTNCEINFDDCASNPCDYGICKDGINRYECVCKPGFTGETGRDLRDKPHYKLLFLSGPQCKDEIDECQSNPCRNGGTCVDDENGFHCQCPEGFHDPYCYSQVDECASSPCLHGACRDDPNGYSSITNFKTSRKVINGDFYRCDCEPGWVGKNCNLDRNDCLPSPCQNAGTCFDQLNGFTCKCRQGFRGNLCQVNINECASSPCLNRGTCVDGVASFTCLCEPPYSGPTCAELLTPCTPNPCANHGSCVHTPDYLGYQCNCQPGWQGQLCTIDINECTSNPCKNRGTCTNTSGGYVCSCRAGYTGPNCETDINDCSPNPCLNGGSCTDGVNSFRCSCLPGFTGTRCATEVNECQSAPCKNGGTCTDYVNSYTCTCKPGFTGLLCETNIPDCTESSCFNGGTCTDGINGFKCTCRSGFTGDYCQYEVNECDSQPCLNGGVCQDALESYRCSCPKGYTGPRCQYPVDWCRPSNPCKNGGRCRQKDASFTCDCLGSWSGRYCDIPGVSCEVAARQRGLQTDELCHHGGHCVNTGNTHYCKCPADYTGSYCESQFDHCEDKPCLNGATCRSYMGGFNCDCMPGYEGNNCEREVNECQSHPCQNGGTCIDLVGHYICSCPPGTLGVLCEINEDDCSTPSWPRVMPKCQNNGTCVDRVGGYRCNCPPGFTGERCEGDINECLSNPCNPSNSLDCIQLPNDYQCMCKPGFTGRGCQNRFSVCESQPCKNGGVCSMSGSSPLGYTCTCQLGYAGANCERSMNCKELPCYNGGSCTLTSRGARCTCILGFGGPLCQHRSNEGCSSKPCRNGGLCTEETSFPFFHCQCINGWKGIRCEQEPRLLPLPPPCPIAECHGKANDGVCDKECNSFACRWDGGDCSLAANPWARCSDPRCWRLFNNSQCDEFCNNAECLYDNFDCKNKEKVCNPIYETYCTDHYADGLCDQGCNTEECGWDGLDCAEKIPEDLAEDVLVIVVLLPPEELLRTQTAFLQKLSAILRTTLRFRLDQNGEYMIRPYKGRETRIKRELQPQQEVIGSIVYLDIDNRLCSQGSDDCFRNANSAAEYLGALSAREMLNFPYPLKEVRSEKMKDPDEIPEWGKLLLVGVASLFLLVILMVGMLIARRKREHSTLWFPEGFFLKKETSSNKNRREPVGQDSLGMKHMPKTVEESLLADHIDSRQWTQHHLAAADIRMPPSMALTPPQGEFDSDCMDVNVRGPDGFTPLMLASFCGGGLEPEVTEDDDSEECSANIISDLIYQGASLAAQTDRTGETALHLAARYARADAAKRLLDAGADANAQDNTGRTPLHAAVAADAQGVFQILIRNRATDLDARMYDGSTALILAARLAVEGMVEELITCHADVNAVDEIGKSALHWAAAVNNVEATVALLKNGANKDMQDLKEETPLFLAAREGSCEAVKVLLAHFANREITDHMDRLPRDIAQERMHHDIVQLLDEYNTVRSPQGHPGAGHHLSGSHTLSPLMCPPSNFLQGLKSTPHGKKNRRTGAKSIGGQHASSLKDSAKGRNKRLTLDMQSALLESSVTLSPVDSLDSPRGGASNAGYITNPTSPAAMPSPGLFHSSMSVPTTPMVHSSILDGTSPFAVSLAQLSNLSDGGLSMQGRVAMQGGIINQGPHNCVLNGGQMSLNMGMVSPVSVPFDWHNRMPPSSQCSQPMVSIMHPASSQAGMIPQTPTLQQSNMLMHQQQMFRNAQQPILQPTPISNTPSISPVKLPPIAEQQPQQLHSHALTNPNLTRMGSSTPPTPQQAQPPPAFYQPQQPQTQPPQALAAPQASQAQAIPSQAPPAQASVSTAGPEDYPTPPSQHSCSSAMDATPKHYLHVPSEHPYLTPSPESPEPWSSPSPHCVSDWSDSTPSPAVTAPAQTQISHVQESNGKMQVFA